MLDYSPTGPESTVFNLASGTVAYALSLYDLCIEDTIYRDKLIPIIIDEICKSQTSEKQKEKLENFIVALSVGKDIDDGNSVIKITNFPNPERLKRLETKINVALQSHFWTSGKVVLEGFDPLNAFTQVIETQADNFIDECEDSDNFKGITFEDVQKFNNYEVNTEYLNFIREVLFWNGDIKETEIAELIGGLYKEDQINLCNLTVLVDIYVFAQTTNCTTVIEDLFAAHFLSDPLNHGKQLGMFLSTCLSVNNFQDKSFTEVNERILALAGGLIDKVLQTDKSADAIAAFDIITAKDEIYKLVIDKLNKLRIADLLGLIVKLKEYAPEETVAEGGHDNLIKYLLIPNIYEILLSSQANPHYKDAKSEILECFAVSLASTQRSEHEIVKNFSLMLAQSTSHDCNELVEIFLESFDKRIDIFGDKSKRNLTASLIVRLRDEAMSSKPNTNVVESLSETILAIFSLYEISNSNEIKSAISKTKSDLQDAYSVSEDGNRKFKHCVELLNEFQNTNKPRPYERQAQPGHKHFVLSYPDIGNKVDFIMVERDSLARKLLLNQILQTLNLSDKPQIAISCDSEDIFLPADNRSYVRGKVKELSLGEKINLMKVLPISFDFNANGDPVYKEARLMLKLVRTFGMQIENLLFPSVAHLRSFDESCKDESLDLVILSVDNIGQISGWEMSKGPRLDSNLLPAETSYKFSLGWQHILKAKKIVLLLGDEVEPINIDRIIIGDPSNDCPASRLKEIYNGQLVMISTQWPRGVTI